MKATYSYRQYRGSEKTVRTVQEGFDYIMENAKDDNMNLKTLIIDGDRSHIFIFRGYENNGGPTLLGEIIE